MVVDNITSVGWLDSPLTQRVFGAYMEGFVAAVLLLIGGERGLSTLQTAVISTGLPFSIILTVMTISLIEGIKTSHVRQKRIRDINHHKK